MVRRRHHGPRVAIKRLVGLISLFIVPILSSDAQGVELSLSSTRLREGQELLVQLEVDYPTPEEVRLIGDLAIEKLTLVDGPTMQTIRDVRFAEQLRTLVQLVYRADTAGRTVIPAFEIGVAGQGYSSEPSVVEIIDPDVDADIVPPDLAWRVGSRRVLEGQAVSVLLELRNLTDFTFPDNLSVSNPSSGLFQEVQGIGSVRRLQVGEVELLSIPIATFIFTPSLPGEVTIPAAEMRLGPFSRRSAPVTIAVDPLPDSVTGTGAVGRYEYDTWVSPEEVRLGDTVEVTMRVEGEGNLDFFRFPALDVPDTIVIGTREESRFSPSEVGYRGYRLQVIELSPQVAGVLALEPPRFWWVNPATRGVQSSASQVLRVSVTAADTEEVETAVEVLMEPLTPVEVDAVGRRQLYDRWTSYLLLLPGPIILLIAALWRRRRRILPAVFGVALVCLAFAASAQGDLVDEGVKALEEGRHLDAVDHFRTALLAHPNSAGLYYNLAVAYQRLEEPAYTVYNLRRAVRERPLEPRFREALRQVESELGMEGQLEPGGMLHPDSYLIAGIVLVNLLFLVLALRRLPRGGRIILSTVLLVFSLSAFGILGYRVTIGDQPVAVVGPGPGEIRRIPDAESNPWMTLPASTPVEVVKRMPPLVLVRTAYGVEGWIGETAVLSEEDGG